MKAIRSRRSPKAGSPVTESRSSSEYMASTTAHSSVPCVGLLAGEALVAGEHARDLAVVAVEDLEHLGRESPLRPRAA